MLNSMVVFAFFVLDRNILFGQIWSNISKSECPTQVSLYKVFILTVTIYRVEFKEENNDQVNISKNAFRSMKSRWSTRQSSTFFQVFFKVSTLYHMCKSISPTGCFGYNKMLRDGLEIFLKCFSFITLHKSLSKFCWSKRRLEGDTEKPNW